MKIHVQKRFVYFKTMCSPFNQLSVERKSVGAFNDEKN